MEHALCKPGCDFAVWTFLRCNNVHTSYNCRVEHFYAVVMAGGSGTRFWPLSRKHQPKQTLPILGPATMVRQTVERLFPLFDPRQVFVVTGREHADLVRRDLDIVPQENIID